MFHIIPREEKYFESFKGMAQRISLAAESLLKLFDDIENADRYAGEIYAIEQQCDDLAHEVFRRLTKSFVTPIDREDIYALMSALDTIADTIESTTARISMYGVTETTPAMRELGRILADTVAAVGQSIEKLPSNQIVIESLVKVHDLEIKGDSIYRKAVRELFAETGDALTIIKYKEVYEKLEESIDACEHAASVLESIALKNS